MRHVFVDESSQNGHHFMVLGALIVPLDQVAACTDAIEGVLGAHRMGVSEFKWTKVSNGKREAYRALVDLHFDTLVRVGVEFHAVVVDCQVIDHRYYNGGDEDLGYNKFLYQLLLHRVGKRFGHEERIVVDLDARNTARDPMELQVVLNRAMSRELGSALRPPFARIAHRDSKGARLLQMADLLSGALAWHKNDQDARAEASVTKVDLANHVASRVGLRRLGGFNSARSETRLSVWNLAMRPPRRGGAR